MKAKKSILLVTIQDDYNIGNRLQNYALQYLLTNHGFEVTNLKDRIETSAGVKENIKIIIKNVLSLVGIKKYKKQMLIENNMRNRYMANKQFSINNINNIIQINHTSVYEEDWSKYSLGIVGSDQVWHKWFDDGYELPYYYLQFLPKEKRVSYAASFGFEDFPAEDKVQHIEGIQGMNKISCRESGGCRLVEQVTGEKVPHVLDPTLLLTKNEWENLIKDSNEYSKNQGSYIFVYFLGNITSEYQKEIDKIANSRKTKIIDFLNFEDENISSCGPKEFVNLIKNADYIFTDSFHCCVFSILFNKDFKAFRRSQSGMEKMFNRIEELLVNTGNQDKAFGGVSSNIITKDFQKLQQASLDYLEEILRDRK
ncbi:polysaccharide pyruvyl transferase family protein [Ligilactobacillus equi]|uniref:Polysaccharide pyruvyl transferase domain-containing protein n=1 Tax=Ligilactobacillus equi DSM 15833 = JCM 10991 TaxID=1423740 RepID=A0A0R1TML0_9LACO|nr:polysaccharide pyruvyl transferase family protein [Ligilactobacillus equi]KRL79701.1 hypothetical protein FC36_GL000400 [Ligilactobacillus equi DSM 15833 = JCM 10991]